MRRVLARVRGMVLTLLFIACTGDEPNAPPLVDLDSPRHGRSSNVAPEDEIIVPPIDVDGVVATDREEPIVGRAVVVVDARGAMSRMTMSAGSDRDVIPLVRINPDYPPRALSRGLEGWVQVQFTITATGTVKDAVVVNADPKNIFDDAALKAIARWRYNPKVENGTAVERVGVQTIIRFQLEQ